VVPANAIKFPGQRWRPSARSTIISRQNANSSAPETALPRLARAILSHLRRPEVSGLLRLVIAEQHRIPELAAEFQSVGKGPAVGLAERYFAAQHERGRLAVPDPLLAAQQFLGAVKESLFWPAHIGVPTPAGEDAVLDTCESGALVAGHTQSRTGMPASEAAIGRLHEATGRPVLTAAATGKPAFEGYKGHGVFTYALMEALHMGDANNNGRIELTELVAHVAKRVPELAADVERHGGAVKGVAVTATRGASGDKQPAHFGSTGEDFTLVARLP
jgi:hypothetical protein